MDFSILIPVYNHNIQALAAELHRQASKLTPNFQILFIDDCSDLSSSYLNQKVKTLENVAYEVLTDNIGRAAIRNLLFSKAEYLKCIILDGDVSITKTDFLTTYLGVLKEDNLVVGGHIYQNKPPKDNNKYLHWLYGSQIESRPAAERQTHAYDSFMTSNFACSKEVFNKVHFDESIRGYGHEDTLFGRQLEKLGIPILHIQNPVRHDGLDVKEVFISKQKEAVLNLKFLYKNGKLNFESKLIKFSKWTIVCKFISLFEKQLMNNLLGDNPSLLALQAQKVVWWTKSK